MIVGLLLVTITGLILSISVGKVHPFFALLGWALIFGLLSGIPPVEVVDLILGGFAQTLQWIALIMILGTMIGEIASDTGGAMRIAEGTLAATGRRQLPVAMGATGYLISIPVFVDVA